MLPSSSASDFFDQKKTSKKRKRNVSVDSPLVAVTHITTKRPKVESPPWLHVQDVIPQEMHDRLLQACMTATESLAVKKLKFMGKSIDEPRLTQLYTADGHTFTYSGLQHVSKLFEELPEIQEIVGFVQDWMKTLKNLPHPVPDYNTALVNHYRAHTPNDGVSKHADKDGVNHTIASISLGGVRRFNIYRNTTTKSGKVGSKLVEQFYIQPRSVLLMFPGMQSEYKHEIVKPSETKTADARIQAQLDAARINITLREQ